MGVTMLRIVWQIVSASIGHSWTRNLPKVQDLRFWVVCYVKTDEGSGYVVLTRRRWRQAQRWLISSIWWWWWWRIKKFSWAPNKESKEWNFSTATNHVAYLSLSFDFSHSSTSHLGNSGMVGLLQKQLAIVRWINSSTSSAQYVLLEHNTGTLPFDINI